MESCLGGYSDMKDADAEIQKCCDQVKSQVEEKTIKKFAEFRAVKYRTQVVQGTNYLIKVHITGESYIHVEVFKSLPCNGGAVVLAGVQENHTIDDPLLPF